MTSQLFVSGHNLAPYAFQKPRLGRMDEQTLLYTCFVPWRPPEPVNVSQNTCLVAHNHQASHAFSPTRCAAAIAAAYGDEVSTASERDFLWKI